MSAAVKRIENQIEALLEKIKIKYDHDTMTLINSLRIDLRVEKERGKPRPVVHIERMEVYAKI
jgi:hypothetical protein